MSLCLSSRNASAKEWPGQYNTLLPRGEVSVGNHRSSCFLLLGCITPLLQGPAPAKVKEVRRVLILNVFGPLSSPGVALMDEAIVAGLRESPYQIELYSEDLEATLFPDEADSAAIS